MLASLQSFPVILMEKTWGYFTLKHGHVLYKNMGVFFVKTWGCYYL